VEATAQNLGEDATPYRKLMGPLVSHWDDLATDLLRPLGFPRHPLVLSRFGLHALRSAWGLAHTAFVGPRARALFAGLGAHSIMPLDKPGSAAVGLVMCATGHAVGWPIAKGGSQRIAEAMGLYLQSLGGAMVTNTAVGSVEQLPRARAVMLDVTPRQVLSMLQNLPARYRRSLESYRYGPGVFKVEWALDGPVPWRAEGCLRAATIHLGGTLEEIAGAESGVWRGEHPEKPFIIMTQPSLFDSTRSPKGKHTAGAYCHVPNGSDIDMTAAIEAQVERFAPGFRDRIMKMHTMSPGDIERNNANCVGGDIAGGMQDLRRLLKTGLGGSPYSTAVRGVYLCSSSTPPGPGVHGMCGYHAALEALRQMPRAGVLSS
jgi:phytoene dehydrogenase-like protein